MYVLKFNFVVSESMAPLLTVQLEPYTFTVIPWDPYLLHQV